MRAPTAGSVGACAHEMDRDPAISETGILVESVGVLVARVRAAHLLEDVLIPIVVEVGENHPVSFLQVGESAGDGDVGEPFSPSRLRYIRLGIRSW